MKKVLSLVAAALLVASASTAMALSIVGTKHDISPTGTALLSGAKGGNQICVYCHTPHNALLAIPLWNRTNATTAFTLYSGVGMANVSFKTGFTTDSTSLFCMSCHDGITEMQQVGNMPKDGSGLSQGTIAGGSKALLGTNLSTTHPVNFPVVNNTQNDLYLGTLPAKMGSADQFPLFKATGAAGRATVDRSLECGSCHSVHDNAFAPFLRATMAGSALCLGCHNK